MLKAFQGGSRSFPGINGSMLFPASTPSFFNSTIGDMLPSASPGELENSTHKTQSRVGKSRDSQPVSSKKTTTPLKTTAFPHKRHDHKASEWKKKAQLSNQCLFSIRQNKHWGTFGKGRDIFFDYGNNYLLPPSHYYPPPKNKRPPQKK